MLRAALLIAAGAATGAALWFGSGHREAAGSLAVPSANGATGADRTLSSAAVLSIDPASVSAAAARRVSHRSALAAEFAAASNYKDLYTRLSGLAQRSSEESYYLYRIARACATVTAAQGPAPKSRSARREDFMRTLTDTDPRRAQRIAAFDEANADRCTGLDGPTLTEADLDRMLADAAAGGDPKARAALVEREALGDYWRRAAAAGEARKGSGPPALSDAQIDTLRTALNSRDPEALATAGRMLSNTLDQLSVRLGPNGEVIDNRAFFNAWRLLACDYGAACDGHSQPVLTACAYQGQCGVNSFADYVYYYGSTPYESQLLERYRGLLRNAVETGDWSQVAFVRGPTGTNSSWFFFGP